MLPRLLLIIGFLGYTIILKAQPRNKADVVPDFSFYQIDKDIYSKIKNNLFLRNDSIIGKLEYKVFQNDSLVRHYVHLLTTKTVIKDDTIFILGLEQYNWGISCLFNISLFKNHFDIYTVEWDKEGPFLIEENDSVRNIITNTPCKTKKLWLSKNPNFKTGDSFYGILDFTSLDYNNRRLDKRERVELKVYFHSK